MAPKAPLPGLTSSLRLASGVLTLQTEIAGEPPQVTTTVDFKGRTVRVFRSDVDLGRRQSLAAVARAFHRASEERLRDALERTRRTSPQPAAQEVPPANAEVTALFVEALRALADGRKETGARLIEVVALLLPQDPRVRALAQALEPAAPRPPSR